MTTRKHIGLSRDQRTLMDWFFARRKYGRAAEFVVTQWLSQPTIYFTYDEEMQVAAPALPPYFDNAKALHACAVDMLKKVYGKGLLRSNYGLGWKLAATAREEQLAGDQAAVRAKGHFVRVADADRRQKEPGLKPRTALERAVYTETHSPTINVHSALLSRTAHIRPRIAALLAAIDLDSARQGILTKKTLQECEDAVEETGLAYCEARKLTN